MKISHSRSRRTTTSSRQERAILFTVGGTTFAIPADAIDEIRNLDDLEPCTPAPLYQELAKIRFTLDRQSCRYFVVDAAVYFGITRAHAQGTRLMILRNLRSAVLVDSIERMQDIAGVRALPVAFHGEERRWYRGLTVMRGKVVPVVNADAFLTRAELTLIEANCLPAMKRQEAVNA